MKVLNTKSAPQPIGPYSQAIETNGLIFLSGQIGLEPDSGELASGLEKQTRRALDNIVSVLRAAGCTTANVVKTTVYLRNISDFAKFNEIYSEYFRENPPARTTVEVSGLPKGAFIEIDVIAGK